MSDDHINTRYVPGIVPPESYDDRSWWFIFNSGRLLTVNPDNDASIPFIKDPGELDINLIRKQYLGMLDGYCCYSAETDTGDLPEKDVSFRDLRSLYGVLEDDIFALAGKAVQIVHWDRTHQYCGSCGTPTATKPDERAKQCPKCGFTSFPRISPAVITAVIRNDEILLAHAKHFQGNMYSIIAGFVEPGETLEECVRREILEEVGITVKNIRYFGSQPWPFPDSLMIGFTAEYAGGEVRPDGIEIGDAGWYKSGGLPQIPMKISIARKIIDWFTENY